MVMNLNAVFLPVHAVASQEQYYFITLLKNQSEGSRLLGCEIFLPVSRLVISQLSACTPGSHLTKARSKSSKFNSHGIKPSGQQ